MRRHRGGGSKDNAQSSLDRLTLNKPILAISAPVSRALASSRGVVALESSVFAQGLPRPANARAAKLMRQAVEDAGAVAAVTAVVRGTPTVGLSSAELARFLRGEGIEKVSARDIAAAVARKSDGATTVAGAIALAALAGIRVLATGGIGGVHRGATGDESADLVELARTPEMVVVCTGAKAILDLPRTVERLEWLGVPVVGFRTETFPAFYSGVTSLPVSVTLTSVGQIAEFFRAHVALGRPGAVLVVQPPPRGQALETAMVEDAIARALAEGERAGVRGGKVTPFLLAAVDSATQGRSVEANLALLQANAALAGRIAVGLAKRGARKNR